MVFITVRKDSFRPLCPTLSSSLVINVVDFSPVAPAKRAFALVRLQSVGKEVVKLFLAAISFSLGNVQFPPLSDCLGATPIVIFSFCDQFRLQLLIVFLPDSFSYYQFLFYCQF